MYHKMAQKGGETMLIFFLGFVAGMLAMAFVLALCVAGRDA